MGDRSSRTYRRGACDSIYALGYKRTWSAATLKDVARVPYVRDFIQLVVEHPPFSLAGEPSSQALTPGGQKCRSPSASRRHVSARRAGV